MFPWQTQRASKVYCRLRLVRHEYLTTQRDLSRVKYINMKPGDTSMGVDGKVELKKDKTVEKCYKGEIRSFDMPVNCKGSILWIIPTFKTIWARTKGELWIYSNEMQLGLQELERALWPLCVGPKSREFEILDMGEIQYMKLIERAQRHWNFNSFLLK